MIAAADDGAGYPLMEVLWTIVLFFAFALVVWLLVTVLSDVFRREGMRTWQRVAWTVLVFVLPLLGSLAYLVVRSRAEGEEALGRWGATQLRLDAHTRAVTGDGQYHGLRDEAARDRAMSGPIRPA
ncbi:PLDc N-terminal domain-containing protein [Geodermatophilus sp. SYSU D00691]